MTEVALSPPIPYKERTIVAAVSVPSSFFKFASALEAVNTAGNYKVHVQRARMVALSRMRDEAGDLQAIAYDDIPSLPVALGRALLSVADLHGTRPSGKVSKEGDGLDEPIVFELGTPLRVTSSKGGDTEVTELEFLVPNFGALEQSLAAGSALSQTAAILRQCCGAPQVPAFPHGALPQMLLDQLALEDGLSIMTSVLPVLPVLVAEAD